MCHSAGPNNCIVVNEVAKYVNRTFAKENAWMGQQAQMRYSAGARPAKGTGQAHRRLVPPPLWP